MPYEQKEGDIAVFRVKEKKNERGPDWTGKALIDGVEKDVSLWFKSETMLTGKVKDKFQPDFQKVKQAVDPQAPLDGLEDEIPF